MNAYFLPIKLRSPSKPFQPTASHHHRNSVTFYNRLRHTFTFTFKNIFISTAPNMTPEAVLNNYLIKSGSVGWLAG